VLFLAARADPRHTKGVREASRGLRGEAANQGQQADRDVFVRAEGVIRLAHRLGALLARRSPDRVLERRSAIDVLEQDPSERLAELNLNQHIHHHQSTGGDEAGP
jgi:hypothetical protein